MRQVERVEKIQLMSAKLTKAYAMFVVVTTPRSDVVSLSQMAKGMKNKRRRTMEEALVMCSTSAAVRSLYTACVSTAP